MKPTANPAAREISQKARMDPGPSSENFSSPGASNSSPSSPSNPSNRQHGSSSGLECLPDGNSLSQECRASKDL